MTTDRRTQTVQGTNHSSTVVENRYVLAEGETLTPGEYATVTGTANGGHPEVAPGSVDGPIHRVAKERSHPDRGDQSRTARIDQDYEVAGELVEVVYFRSGDRTDTMLLAAEEVVSAGDALVVNADGQYEAYDAGSHDAGEIAAEAEEDLDLTGSAAGRIEVTFR